MPEYLAPDEEERQESAPLSASALAVLNQSEHASMVQTANVLSNRRKLADFESKLMAYANHSQPVALMMFYSLPRAGKQLIGPSVRFAEIVAPCWRNCAVAGRVVGDASTTVTAQGIFIDYEANLRNSVEVPRRITDKDGKRYSDDMVITTSNAAMSVARRNAVLKGGVPQALWTPSYEAAQLTAVGKNETHAQRVANAMEYLYKMGLTEWQVLNAVGVAGVKELETEHLVTLRVVCAEIKRGDKTVDEVFGSPYDKEIDVLFVQLKMNATQQKMLRNSYLGRAAELAAYLRERVGTVGQGTGKREQGSEKTAPEQSVDDWIAQKSGPAYNTKNPPEATPDSPGLAGEPVNKEPFKAEPLGDFNQITPQEKTVAVDTADGGTSNVTTVSGGAGEQRLDGKRGRGRPTREEMARRRAAAEQEDRQFELEQQLEQSAGSQQSEEQARREVETVMEKTDQFAF